VQIKKAVYTINRMNKNKAAHVDMKAKTDPYYLDLMQSVPVTCKVEVE
jgi:hypothetical protein